MMMIASEPELVLMSWYRPMWRLICGRALSDDQLNRICSFEQFADWHSPGRRLQVSWMVRGY